MYRLFTLARDLKYIQIWPQFQCTGNCQIQRRKDQRGRRENQINHKGLPDASNGRPGSSRSGPSSPCFASLWHVYFILSTQYTDTDTDRVVSSKVQLTPGRLPGDPSWQSQLQGGVQVRSITVIECSNENATQWSTVECSTVQCSEVQYSAVQCAEESLGWTRRKRQC